MYDVQVGRNAAAQLRDAPIELVGFAQGIIATLRADPTSPTVMFEVRGDGPIVDALFPNGRGFVSYTVDEATKTVFVLAVNWV